MNAVAVARTNVENARVRIILLMRLNLAILPTFSADLKVKELCVEVLKCAHQKKSSISIIQTHRMDGGWLSIFNLCMESPMTPIGITSRG